MTNQKTGIIIQARTGSTRLPNKIILPFFQDKTILDIIIEEVKQHVNIPIVLATSIKGEDLILEKTAKKHGILFFAGDENDVLDRFIKAAAKNNFSRIIRICADNPFLQASYINDLIENIKQHDYISFKFPDGTPSILSHIGLFAEGVNLSSLKKVKEETNNSLYLEHVTNYIHGNETLFDVFYLPVANYIEPNSKIRFTLDTIEDFDLLKEIYPLYKNKFNNNIQDFITFILSSKEYLNRMNLEINKNSK